MDFKVSEIINHPLEQVFAVYRDEMVSLVPYMPNVDAIEVVDRQEADGEVKLVNRWKVSGSIPRAVRPFFSDDMLAYLDHAHWVEAERQVSWFFELNALGDAVDCRGTNYFTAASEGSTELILTGNLKVDLAKVRGVPRFLRGFAPKIEAFVLERVKPNLSGVAQAVEQYLNEKKQSSE